MQVITALPSINGIIRCHNFVGKCNLSEAKSAYIVCFYFLGHDRHPVKRLSWWLTRQNIFHVPAHLPVLLPPLTPIHTSVHFSLLFHQV